MPRKMLTDKAWEFIKEILLETGRVYNKYEHRSTFEGILYRMRTGIQWRDLPKEFGSWNTVFKRFNLWSKKGILTKLFEKLSAIHDAQWIFIDGSIVKAHQDSCGARHSANEAIGKVLRAIRLKFILQSIVVVYLFISSFQAGTFTILPMLKT